jgi:hypothetical protein
MKDLIILVADTTIKACIEGVLPRVNRTRDFSYDVITHRNRDGGCRTQSGDLLNPLATNYHKSIIIFDREGSGGEHLSREELEQSVEQSLKDFWEDRVAVIVIDPELETWIWVPSAHVAEATNWQSIDDLFSWLEQENWKIETDAKPSRPKEALEAALRKSKKPFSSSIHKAIAEKASYKHCTDPAFLKLIATLCEWFGQ